MAQCTRGRGRRRVGRLRRQISRIVGGGGGGGAARGSGVTEEGQEEEEETPGPLRMRAPTML